MAKKKPEEGRYSRVTRRIWNSGDFRSLSKAKPNAQTLWFRLLTGPELTAIPGLFVAREGGLAEELDWPAAALRRCLKEILDKGMATFDRGAGLFWVPKSINHNAPESPSAVLGWRLVWKELPDCELKQRAHRELRAWMAAKGPSWVAAFDQATAEAPGEPAPPDSHPGGGQPAPQAGHPPGGHQEQEQEQEQDPPPGPPSPIQARAEHWLSLVNRLGVAKGRLEAEMVLGDPCSWPEVREICRVFSEVWRNDAPRNGADPRVQKILERFAEGYSVDEICEAIRGSKLDENIAANRAFQVIRTVLRDAAQVDKFRDLLANGPGSKVANDDRDDTGGYGPVEDWA